ncbi:MAG TPA: VWA domain-containing protein [Candidatus Acidoferrales bacterium]|nr:VWA domain-containing protein [Candidatus Acidoferrales bacterium]
MRIRPQALTIAIASAAIVAGGVILRARPAHASAQEKQQVIRSETSLVDVLASVSDAHGKPVLDLKQDAFLLNEDGVPQKIERFEPETNRPLDLALMIDSSASTLIDLKFETEAAAHFIRQVVRPGDRLAVFQFDETVFELADFSDDVPKLQSAARKVAPGSGTSMYDAIALGANALRHRGAERRRAIVLVTDAGETTSVTKFDEARHAAIASDALLYSIVIRSIKSESGRNTAGEHALITITDDTGGDFFILDSVNQIEAMFDQIDRELRTQYLLGYYPQPTPPPGSYRHIELKVNTGDTVKYRKAYFAVGELPR